MASVQTTASQVVGDDDVSDGVKHKLNVISICRTRLVTVDFLLRALVLGLELRLDVGGGFLVRLLACNTT